MKRMTLLAHALFGSVLALPALAADYPAPREGSWVVRDFRFTPARRCPSCA